MHRTRIKICGLTRPEDAAAAVSSGADALGVVLAPSRRRVTLDEAERVLAATPPFVGRVGVFVDASTDEIREAAERLSLSAVQLHGSETPEQCAEIGMPVVKAFRVGPDFDPAVTDAYRGVISIALLDTFVSGEQGGTGLAFDWYAIAERLPDLAPVVLAGGLRPDNVVEAIRVLRPFGVDVSSGVETAPGVKDPALIARFCSAVRFADGEATLR